MHSTKLVFLSLIPTTCFVVVFVIVLFFFEGQGRGRKESSLWFTVVKMYYLTFVFKIKIYMPTADLMLTSILTLYMI
jgi:hypothetical protein